MEVFNKQSAFLDSGFFFQSHAELGSASHEKRCFKTLKQVQGDRTEEI